MSLYLQPNSPLKTVFEASSPEHDAPPQSDRVTSGHPELRIQRSLPSNGKRPRPRQLLRTSTPSALLHNDWYLNQLFHEVLDLYRPGSLTGYPIHYRQDTGARSLSLLQSLSPNCEVLPLLPSNGYHPFSRLQYLRRPDLTERRSDSLLNPMPPKRKARTSTAAGDTASPPKAKRTTGGGGRKDLLKDEQHVFSAKSKLFQDPDFDLTSFFASPTAWTSLTPEEQETLRSLLPADTPYDASGAPSQQFLRYDNDWRNNLRLFAEDVTEGRYEPEWQAEAAAASAARRRGDYDRWKEEQFELFWGQKSDAHADLMAGKAVKIRLPEMIAAGLFRLGDVFVYVRSFGKGKDGFLVEKESCVVEVSGGVLTVTMPGGQARCPHPLPPIPKEVEDEVEGIENGMLLQQRRSRSDEVRSAQDRLSAPPEGAMRRSFSAHSPGTPNRLSAPPMPTLPDRYGSQSHSRPGTAHSQTSNADDDVKVNKKRFGFLGSLRRAASGEHVSQLQSRPGSQGSDSSKRSTRGPFNFRRKPVPKMEIVPNGPADQKQNNSDDSDSPLSALSDTDEDDPWREQNGRIAGTGDWQSSDVVGGAENGAASATNTMRSARAMSENNVQSVQGTTKSVKKAKGASHLPAASKKSSSRSATPSQATLPAPARDTNGSAGKTTEGTKYANGARSAVSPLITVTVDSLHTLEQKILEVDGRRKGEPRANAWRTFRCRRNGEDLGTLWDMREKYYIRKYG